MGWWDVWEKEAPPKIDRALPILVVCVFALLVILAILAFAVKPAPGAQQENQTLPAEWQSKILKLQLKQQKLGTEWAQLQAQCGKTEQDRVAAIPGEFNLLNEEIKADENSALREMRLNPEKFVVDGDTFKVTAKPASPNHPEPPPAKKQ